MRRRNKDVPLHSRLSAWIRKNMMTRQRSSTWSSLSTMSSGGLMTSSGEVMTSSGEVMASSGEVITSSGEVTASSGEAMTSSGKMMTSPGEMMTSTGEAITYREINHVDSEPDEDGGSQDVSMDNNTVDGEQDGSTVGQGGVGGGGTGSRGLAATGSRGRDRRPKVRKPRFRFHRAQFQATTASLSPVNMDFSVLSLHERLIQTGKWQKRFNMVRSRPQFRIVSIRTIFSPFTSSRPQDQILAVTFRGGFVIEGTFNAIMSALHSRIVEAVEASFEEDAAAAALAGINA